MLRDDVERIWPELAWINDQELREKTTNCWVRAFELSPLKPDDLDKIPFTLKVEGCPVSFLAHKRLVVAVMEAVRSRRQKSIGHSSAGQSEGSGRETSWHAAWSGSVQ